MALSGQFGQTSSNQPARTSSLTHHVVHDKWDDRSSVHCSCWFSCQGLHGLLPSSGSPSGQLPEHADHSGIQEDLVVAGPSLHEPTDHFEVVSDEMEISFTTLLQAMAFQRLGRWPPPP